MFQKFNFDSIGYITKLPIFGRNTFKRHDVAKGQNDHSYDGFSYEPRYEPTEPDSPRIVQLKPSWLASAMASLGRHIGTTPQKVTLNTGERMPPSTKGRVITDRNTIMKLNFRHVLRGA